MDRSWWWRMWLVVGVTLGTVWFLVPTYYSFFVLPKEHRNNLKMLEERLPRWAPPAHYRLNLGLDLQGGIHMVMRVDTRTAMEKRVERRAIQMANTVRDRKLGEVTATANPEKLQITLVAKDPATMDAIAKDLLTGFGSEFTEENRDGGTLVLGLKESQAEFFKTEAVDQAILVIRRRIDKWGVAEADIRKQGNDSIQISLPGYQDPEKAKELIGTTAQLEFRMVDDQSTLFRDTFTQSPPPPDSGITFTAENFGHLEGADREALLAYMKDKVPADRQVLLECTQTSGTKGECMKYRAFLVERGAGITGESLASADANVSQLNEPEVNITFDAQGARDFEQLTEKNVGRYMAIVLDDNIHSAPRINEKIPGGTARITMGRAGNKTFDAWLGEAQTLALVLKAGALPAPVTTGEIRQVGAQLGPELIRKGSLAAALGLALVVIFMAIYYRRAGLVADVALVLNGALILAALALFNATLTLPGIAGFVLTLGMAVDANVLINERIREELGHGKTARAAVDQGYDRAFWTIFDAHVTTLIAGFILFYTGTGPVRGFATALIVGLIASMFTSIVVTRVITTYFVHGRNASTVSI